MPKLEIKRSILARLIPGLTSLTRRGSAGWMTIIGSVIVSSMVVMVLIGPWISPHDPTGSTETGRPERTYALTITSTIGGTTNPAPQVLTYDEETTVTVTAIPDSGYHFLKWELDGVVYVSNPIHLATVTDHVLHAIFSEIPPTPTEQFNINVATTFGGTTDPEPQVYTHDKGTTVTVTAIPDSAYRFLKWELDGASNVKKSINVTMDRDHSLLAVFVLKHPSPPSAQYPLGTNLLGQDMLSRILSGGAIMLQVAVLSVFFCFIIGVPIGLLASYTGGIIEKTFSLVMDSFYAFPGLVLAIAIAVMMGRGVVNMALSIAVVYVPSYFRIVRSQVLTIKELPYTEAARATGARGRTILLRYVLPNVVPSIVAVATVNFADAILTAAGLTFVGLGVGIDVPDWGWDLTQGRALLPSGSWWVITFPGIMIVLLALGFTLIGEGLSELLTPRLEQ